MRRWGVMSLAVAAAALLVLAIPSIAVADKPSTDAEALLPAQPVDADLIPVGCLPAQPMTCNQIPMPQGASCSCNSTLLDVHCRTCETGERGQVLSTTCTVVRPCTNPPCNLEPAHIHTSYSCET